MRCSSRAVEKYVSSREPGTTSGSRDGCSLVCKIDCWTVTLRNSDTASVSLLEEMTANGSAQQCFKHLLAAVHSEYASRTETAIQIHNTRRKTFLPTEFRYGSWSCLLRSIVRAKRWACAPDIQASPTKIRHISKYPLHPSPVSRNDVANPC
jgi:hypothetical protein